MASGMSLWRLCWRTPLSEAETASKAATRTVYNGCHWPQQAVECGYRGNKITTTKYTWLTFLPKNLFEQLHRAANFYFVSIVILNFVPEVAAFGKEVAFIPVAIVIAVTCIKDGVEDYRRHHADTKVNMRPCYVYCCDKRQYVKRRWMDVCVGDFVRVPCNELIPADLLLTACRSDDARSCYLETSNLDGESNLKQRVAVSYRSLIARNAAVTSDDVCNCIFPQDFDAHVECDQPNAEIYKFSGRLVQDGGSSEQAIGLTKDNLVLRGCCLRNTDAIEGLVIYAGHETKALMNTDGPRYKRSRLEQYMNRDVLWCIVILLFLCFFSAIGSGIWLGSWRVQQNVPYIPFSDGDYYIPGYQGFIVFWTYVIIYQAMVPLSLYASLEIIKAGQVFFVQQDLRMYYTLFDRPVTCRALNITEDLGQVQHVFCDKTGTLTENKMLFRALSVGRQVYVDSEHSGNSDNTVSPEEQSNTLKAVSIGEVGLASSTGSFLHPDAVLQQASPPRSPVLQQASPPRSPVLQQASPPRSPVLQQASPPRSPVLQQASPPRSPVLQQASPPRSPVLQQASPPQSPVADIPSCMARTNGLPAAANAVSADDTLLEELLLVMALCNTVFVSSHSHAPLSSQESVSEQSTSSRTGLGGGFSLWSYQPLGESTRAAAGSSSGAQLAKTLVSFLPRRERRVAPAVLHLSAGAEASNSSDVKDGKSLGIVSSASFLGLEERALKERYEAESPDELALVKAACRHGSRLMARDSSSVTVWLTSKGKVTFDVLATLPFDSVRRRMSVVIRHPTTGHIVLYCKGADSAVLSQLTATTGDAARFATHVRRHVNKFAKIGLRTLCMAKKELTELEFAEWSERRHLASLLASDTGGNSASLSNLADECSLADSLEQNLQLIGATGIEDKLQAGVCETIAALREADITSWLLTGDKQETAVNIGYSCGLIAPTDVLLTVDLRSCGDDEDAVLVHLENLARLAAGSSGTNGVQYVLLVEGSALDFLLRNSSSFWRPFLAVTAKCRTVFCCRTTPSQKAIVVDIVKKHTKALTLAIGDGANDVNMIRTAHVGVGISGVEGSQAAMAADFAISQFSQLRQLLFVHGHWCYNRLATVVLYNFYKNANLIFVLFWYQFYNGFSGQVAMDQIYLLMFHVVFTSFPPLVVGILDKDLPATTLWLTPALYKQGPRNELYHRLSYWLVLLDAFYQSLTVFFIPLWAYKYSDIDLWSFGSSQTTLCLAAQMLTVALETKTWTIAHLLTWVLSCAVYWMTALVLGATCVTYNPPSNPYWNIQHSAGMPSFWLLLALVSITAITPRTVAKIISDRRLTREPRLGNNHSVPWSNNGSSRLPHVVSTL